MRLFRRIVALVLSVVAATAFGAAPHAYAEGRFEFKVYGWWAQFVSDEWFDNDTDGALTEIRLQECTSNPKIGLERWTGTDWYLYPWQPIYYCLNADGGWKNWGSDLPRGRYRMVVLDPRSDSGQVSVRFVTVKY